jgi:integrase
MLAGETNFGEPSKGKFEAMARRRFQDPKPKRSGKWWYLLLWQDEVKQGRRIRKRKRVKLAPATMPEREVQKIAAEHLRPLNQGLESLGSATRLEEYVQSVYRPVVMPLLAKSTRDRYKSAMKNYVIPTFGQRCLRDLTPLEIQRYLSGLAELQQSQESKDKIKDVLSAILGSAVKYGYLVKNPVEGLRLPPPKTGRRSKPFVRPDQFLALLALLKEPYASMAYVAVYTGLRPSELLGLLWRNIHEDSITVEQRYCRGDWGVPKTEASNATIAVNVAVIHRIHQLKTLVVTVAAGKAVRRYPAVRADGPDDLVFQSPVKGGPMHDNNILVRHIKPAARKLGIPWLNWQVLRRSFATWLKMAGADVKDAQALMRHSRASTTLDIYQQFVPESQRRVVENLGRLVEPVVVN